MRFSSIDPRTGKMGTTYKATEEPEVRAAFLRARAGARQWSTLPREKRIDVLRDVEKEFLRRKDEQIGRAHV